MFRNEDLEKHLATSSTLRINSAVIAEWNMNIATNIERLGNYRYRPEDADSPQYNFISQSYSQNDDENKFYIGATDADVIVDGGFDEQGIPLAFVSKKEKEKLLYSLEDCFGRFRPRSGINKLRYFDSKYSHFTNVNMAERPRYYMASKDDGFKYWTSYRTEDGIERGIANININGANFIQDAAPFVVYRDQVPANRIVVKMQTNVGTRDLGPFIRSDSTIPDPFFGPENQTTPVRWRIEYLDNQDTWVSAASFDENSVRQDGSPIVGPDGYVELFYGVVVPEEYRETFNFETTLSNEILLPDPKNMPTGIAYLVISNQNDSGTIYVVVNNSLRNSGVYETFDATYGWFVDQEDVGSRTAFVTELVSPPSFFDPVTGAVTYREFEYIRGLRVVVETMNVFDSTLDLIELSPRLSVNLSDKVVQFSITKSASDLGITGLPVGQLLASVGSVEIFDFDQAFFQTNKNSIIANYTSQNIQFKFYEIVRDVDGADFYIPIKTMYSEGFPDISGSTRSVSISLRDLFFYFESRKSPQVFIQNASISYAISLLLDSIGFSNYVFRRNTLEKEEVIPFFFVAPDKTIAQVLQEIAISTQTAMFFDEFNNFVMMSRNYMLPEDDERETDTFLYGSKDFESFNEVKNRSTKENIANILDVSFRENQVYNDGTINYQTRSIQRSYGSLRQASLIDREKNWIYKPVLLWEAEGQENVRSQNEETANQSAFALTALPLNSDLSDQIPAVQNHRIINNVIDFGDGVYWTTRHDGYFFANGEIIRYDAIQYSIPGISQLEPDNPNLEGDNVWINSVAEYQSYFSKIPFNGKMYPTGLVRIYVEPHFEVVEGITRLKNGPVAKHGRGQFGTQIVNHFSGLSDYWTNINNRRGCSMDFKYVFDERVLRGRIEEVVLESNASTGAVLKAADVTIVQVGNYLFKEFSSVDRRSDVPVPEPTINLIPKNTFVKSVNVENGTITLNNQITSISSTELEQVDGGSADVINSTVIEIEGLEGISVGMYIVNRDEEETINVIQANTQIASISGNRFTLNKPMSSVNTGERVSVEIGRIAMGSIILAELAPNTENGPAGIDGSVFKNSSISGVIKNVLATQYIEENPQPSKYPPTVQSSALVFKGNIANTTELTKNFISYVYKPMESRFRHFGTRMRIIGKIENNEFRGQTADGASTYYSAENVITGRSPIISGGSGGIAIMINPSTNAGYYFEIAALADNDRNDPIPNLMFYKIQRSVDATADTTNAIPIKLFTGQGNILVDEGSFVGQSRLSSEKNPTVYDLAVEYEDIEGTRVFYLYLNNIIVGIAEDPNPLPVINNMALFVRGNAKCMFENIYALSENYSQNTTFSLETPVNSAFGEIDLNAQSSMLRYAVSGLIQSTYLSGIGTLEPPKYNIYFEEFGTIMREAAYFNVRYDKAFPALFAKIAETFNRVKGYTVSGFFASAYGAEFLVFNHTDSVLNLDSTSGNYLRIQGVTFTQQSSNEFKVDEYFQNRTNFADPVYVDEGAVISPIDEKKYYTDIKLSRMTEGTKEFTIDAPYIQSRDAAERMMDWLVKKIMKPRKSVGVSVFGMPHLQLGDILEIDFKTEEGVDDIAPPGKRFVIYNIEYARSAQDVQMSVFLSEVN
jgi:hypothetical protein